MRLPPVVLAAAFFLCLGLPPLVGAAAANTSRVVMAGKSHSLTDSYQFDPRDGWEPVVVTNMRYKYRRSRALPHVPTTPGTNSSSALKRPATTDGERSSRKSVLRSAAESLAELTKSIAVFGKAEPVTITWYTGHDLRNPSCWSEPTWTPTDKSFVAALTLHGWSEKPKCFNFLELCSNSTQCTFVRVVDSCAGCETGSKHVDLTQAAFEQLAPLDKGVMTVQMRQASEPTDWDVDLWGPKDN